MTVEKVTSEYSALLAPSEGKQLVLDAKYKVRCRKYMPSLLPCISSDPIKTGISSTMAA